MSLLGKRRRAGPDDEAVKTHEQKERKSGRKSELSRALRAATLKGLHVQVEKYEPVEKELCDLLEEMLACEDKLNFHGLAPAVLWAVDSHASAMQILRYIFAFEDFDINHGNWAADECVFVRALDRVPGLPKKGQEFEHGQLEEYRSALKLLRFVLQQPALDITWFSVYLEEEKVADVEVCDYLKASFEQAMHKRAEAILHLSSVLPDTLSTLVVDRCLGWTIQRCTFLAPHGENAQKA